MFNMRRFFFGLVYVSHRVISNAYKSLGLGAYTKHTHINKVMADMYVQRLGGFHQNPCKNILHYSRIKQLKEILQY